MGVYESLCVSRSIDSASVPQRLCDAANSQTSGVESKCEGETTEGLGWADFRADCIS